MGPLRPALRVAPATRPASEPSNTQPSTSPAQSSSDLGSDSEWKFHAGVISDDDPAPESISASEDDDQPIDPLQIYSVSDSHNPIPVVNIATIQPVTSEDANGLKSVVAIQTVSDPCLSDVAPSPAFKWHNTDSHLFVNDVNDPVPEGPQPALPHSSQLVSLPRVCHSQDDFLDVPTFSRSPQPASAFTNPTSEPPSTVTPHPAYHPPTVQTHPYADDPNRLSDNFTVADGDADDEYDADESFDQQIVIPGYRGVSTRAAPDLTPPSRPHTWADRPRGPTTANSILPPASDPASGKNSPALARLHRVGSDSAVSSQGGSIGSGSAFRLSTRTSSEASDSSRRTTSKSVSFLSPGGDFPHSLYSEKLEPPPVSESPVTGEVPSLPHVQLSTQIQTRQPGATRIVLSDGKAKVVNALSSTSTDRNVGLGTESTLQVSDGFSEMSNSPENADPEVLLPPSTNASHESAQPRIFGPEANSVGFERMPSKSDAAVYRRQPSGLSTSSSRAGRPLPADKDNSLNGYGAGIVRSGVAEHGTMSNTLSPTQAKLGLSSITPGSSTLGQSSVGHKFAVSGHRKLSFLECVAEILKETKVLRRCNIVHAKYASIWLTSNLRYIHYRIIKKNSLPNYQTIELARVRRLKGTDRSVVIDIENCKKSFDFQFNSPEAAEVWLFGLCCLIPSNASVKSRYPLESRQLYNPLLDTWSGRPVSSRKQIGEYILLETIGRGSFGKVKLALSRSEMQFYAVKILSKAMMRKRLRSQLDTGIKDLSTGIQLKLSDVNEIAIMEGLDHTNVMKLKQHCEDNQKDLIFIVVEYLAQGPIMSSAKLTDATPISEDDARRAFVDVLAGLEYLHYRGIAHRDIKPDNLLQAGDGTVKISDFGVAIRYSGNESEDDASEDIQSQGRTVGTPAFTAPELCLSEKSPPCPKRVFAADIWSLGASLFYMLYGRAPFIARSVFEMYDAICTQPLVIPDSRSVSPAAQYVIRIMLKKSPTERAKIGDIIRTDWLRNWPPISLKISQIRTALMEHDPSFRAEVGSLDSFRMEPVHKGLPQMGFPRSPRFHR